MQSADLMTALKTRFAPPAYALFEEVANATGFQASRSADAIVITLWPSRGLELQGFELKTSRIDWLRELKNPAKAEEIASYCDRWWIVVSDKSILMPGELPPTWGLMVPHSKTVKAVVEAPQLTPKPLDRLFLAAILRRAHEHEAVNVQKDLDILRAQAKKEAYQQASASLRQLQETVTLFEKAAGIRITDKWEVGDIGKAVRLITSKPMNQIIQDLQDLARTAERVRTGITNELKASGLFQQQTIEKTTE